MIRTLINNDGKGSHFLASHSFEQNFFNLIVVKPSHNFHNYSDEDLFHKKGDMNKGDPFIVQV